jgi:uroporphyrinogen decarboxylase
MHSRPNFHYFIQTLNRQPAGFVPLAELGVHPKIKERFLGRPLLTLADEVDFWHRAGYDYVKLQPAANFYPGGIGQSENLTYNPDGTIFRKWASEGQGIIRSAKDLEQYPFPSPTDFDYSRFEQVRRYLPDGLGVVGQYGDIFTMTWEMMGFESFSLALYEDPHLVERLNATLGELVLDMFRSMANSEAVGALWYSDDIAYGDGLMVSPGILRKLFFPWLKKIGDLAREVGKPLIYHTDGLLYSVMDDIIACGVTALHPIEPNAMDLGEVKRRYGNRLCLIGGVDVDLLSRGTPAEVKQKARECIEVAAYDGGYCLGSGNSIPEYVNFENYLALLQSAREFGEGRSACNAPISD